MLIQTSSPRPIINLQEHPQHVVVHTLRKPGVSTGTVLFNMNTDIEHGTRSTAPVEPYEVFPIEGDPGFEALEYYLPFDIVFGKGRQTYNEGEIMQRQIAGMVKRIVTDTDPNERPRDTLMALYATSGISIIAKSAFRSQGSQYEERVLNFQLFFPITGGGIVRIAGVGFDIANPTFDPKAPLPGPARFTNQTLLEAFNRTHKAPKGALAARRAARIAQAEASMRAERGLPPKKDDEP